MSASNPNVPHGWWEWALAILWYGFLSLPVLLIVGLIVYNVLVVPIMFIGRLLRSGFEYLDRALPPPRQTVADRRRAEIERAIEVETRIRRSGEETIEQMRRHAERR